MAVLTNTMLQGTAADTGDDAYQIEKSLRFNDNDSGYLTKPIGSNGNLRTWTFATWIKHHGKLAGEAVNVKWLTASYQSQMQLLADGTILINFLGNTHKLQTNRVFRDPTAWLHLVITCDTTNAVNTDRLRVYVNGQRETSFSTATYPDQHDTADWLKSGENLWIGRAHDAAQYGDGYLADTYLIDGLALSPAAFGSFDSTGVFNPKAFALPAPNDGTDWSDTTANSSGGSLEVGPKANLFDGSITGDCQIGSNDGLMTLTTGTFPLKATLRFHMRGFTSNYTYLNTLQINDDYYYWKLSAENSWVDIPLKRSYDSVTTFKYSFAGSADKINAIEVDGVILVDGQTDVSTRNNPNNGTEWSNALTVSSGSITNAANAFNGNDTEYAESGSNGEKLIWTPSSPITFTKLEVLQNQAQGNSQIRWQSNADDSWSSWEADIGKWQTLSSSGGVLKALETERTNGTKAQLWGVKIDDHVLLDSTSDNSFHLKFNETSIDRYFGLDTINGKLTDATGGTPLLKTTDDYGLTLGSGNATDSFSDDLKFAFAGNNVTGASLDISGSGHSCTNTNALLKTNQSLFYGSSIQFSGDAKITTPTHSDFDLGTTNWTVEFWSRPSQTSSQSALVSMGDNGNGSDGILVGYASSGNLFCYGSNTGAWNLFSAAKLGPERVGTWSHYAVTRQGSTFRFFNNGVLMDTKTHAGDVGQSVNAFTIGVGQIDAVGANAYIHGNIQDFRYYNHGSDAPKYTAAFTVPKRNDLEAYSLKGSDQDGKVTGSPNTSNGALIIRGPNSGADAFYSTLSSASDTRYWYSNNGTAWYFQSEGTSETINGYKWAAIGHGGASSRTAELSHALGSSYTWDYTGDWSGAGGYTHDATGFTYTTFPATTAHNDSSVESPTNYGEDTGAGGEVRGNYCTWNPLDRIDLDNVILTEGNLKIQTPSHTTSATAYGTTRGTMGVTSGKWYWEIYNYTQHGSTGTMLTGIMSTEIELPQTVGDGGNSVSYAANDGKKRIDDGVGATYGDTYTTGDIIGVALDMDNGAVYFSKNGTWQASGVPTSGSSRTNAANTWTPGTETYTPAISDFQEGSGRYITASLNAGQRAFKYTAPSGYKCLCTQNLENTFSGAEENNPSKYFDIALWEGNGASAQTINTGFGPDMVWFKERTSTSSHAIVDNVRGSTNAAKVIYPDRDDAEVTATSTSSITSLNSDGFTIGSSDGSVNQVNELYVGWAWDAGTAAATASTEGSITPSGQWKNATAGFSITTYTGTGSAATVGHGLSVKPDMYIIKNRSTGSTHWLVYTDKIDGSLDYFFLDDTDAKADSSNSLPTNTVFSVGSGASNGASGDDYVCYSWAGVPGYSAFGSYTGNANADGPFVYTGFRVKYLLQKRSDAASNWQLMDSARDDDHDGPGNPIKRRLKAEGNDAEFDGVSTNTQFDFLSNGFKIRDTDSGINANSGTYIYAAFAEHPFKTSRAQ